MQLIEVVIMFCTLILFIARFFMKISQVVKTFFRTNRHTCLEWLSRIRMSLLTIAVHSGRWACAVRQGFELLRDLEDAGTTRINVWIPFVSFYQSFKQSSSSSGAIFYSVGDHVLPYSMVPLLLSGFQPPCLLPASWQVHRSSSLVVSLCCMFLPSFLLL